MKRGGQLKWERVVNTIEHQLCARCLVFSTIATQAPSISGDCGVHNKVVLCQVTLKHKLWRTINKLSMWIGTLEQSDWKRNEITKKKKKKKIYIYIYIYNWCWMKSETKIVKYYGKASTGIQLFFWNRSRFNIRWKHGWQMHDIINLCFSRQLNLDTKTTTERFYCDTKSSNYCYNVNCRIKNSIRFLQELVHRLKRKTIKGNQLDRFFSYNPTL